jgi:hypothetical protein
MAFTAKDGSKHTNFSSAKHADARHMAKQPDQKMVAEMNEPDGDEGAEPGMEDPHAVVDQHGPAQQVTVSHEGGKHHVSSMHGDGHQHESDHESAAMAHDHGKCLSGDCDCGGM